MALDPRPELRYNPATHGTLASPVGQSHFHSGNSGMVKIDGEEGQGGQGAEYDVAYEHVISGRLMEAESVCRAILATDPNHAEALHLMGGIAAKRIADRNMSMRLS